MADPSLLGSSHTQGGIYYTDATFGLAIALAAVLTLVVIAVIVLTVRYVLRKRAKASLPSRAAAVRPSSFYADNISGFGSVRSKFSMASDDSISVSGDSVQWVSYRNSSEVICVWRGNVRRFMFSSFTRPRFLSRKDNSTPDCRYLMTVNWFSMAGSVFLTKDV